MSCGESGKLGGRNRYVCLYETNITVFVQIFAVYKTCEYLKVLQTQHVLVNSEA